MPKAWPDSRATAGGIVYVDQRVNYDAGGNVTTNENAWVTPWSATYESDGLDRLKGLKFGVYSGGSISTIVQQEDWQTSGVLKLSQTGNWIDYKRQREGSAIDDWQANTFSDLNTITKIERGASADWTPDVYPKGLHKRGRGPTPVPRSLGSARVVSVGDAGA